MRNIYYPDYIMWDKEKDCPAERLDSVYHYTQVIELFNDGVVLNDSEFVCVNLLPIEWQKKISLARQANIGFPFKKGDTYYTICQKKWQVIESVWDDVAEEEYIQNILNDHEMYYETRERAERELSLMALDIDFRAY